MQVVTDGAQDFWYPFVWQGFRPRAAALDRPADFGADSDSVAGGPPATSAPVTRVPIAPAPPAPLPPTDTARSQFNVSFAVLLDEAKARAQAAKIVVDGKTARVVTGVTDGTAVYRVVLGPYATREQADRAGRASGRSYYIYAGSP